MDVLLADTEEEEEEEESFLLFLASSSLFPLRLPADSSAFSGNSVRFESFTRSVVSSSGSVLPPSSSTENSRSPFRSALFSLFSRDESTALISVESEEESEE